MPFQSVPQVASIEFRATLFGQNVENIMYVNAGVDYTQEDIDDIAEIADNAWNTYVMAQLSDDYVYRETYVKGLENIIDLESTDATHASDTGGTEAVALPGNVAFAIKFQTGHTGRSARGRNYVTGIPEDSVVGNTFDATRANALVSAYTSLSTALNAGGFPHVVVSRYTNGARRTSGIFLPVTTISYTDLNTDSQRGRLTGRGE